MRLLYRNAAYTDASGPLLHLDWSLLVIDGVVEYLGPDDASLDTSAVTVIDAGGTTIVPSMVDAHSHVTLPGGSHWIDRISDSTDELLEVAEHNGKLMIQSGTRWARDVGSPRRRHPEEGHVRGLALAVRDRWSGRRDRPYIRAAGTWIAKNRALPADLAVEAADSDALAEAVLGQLADGANLIKLYMDGPDADVSPWEAHEVEKAIRPAEETGIPVTAHSTTLAGARAAVGGGVDCIEHGTHIDADLALDMAAAGTFIVPTLGVMASFESFATTTTLERFTKEDNRQQLAERRERAVESVRLVHAAGVPIAAGTDFGGGSLRANQLAWEVGELTAAGLEPWQALAAATWRGGDLLGEPAAGRLFLGGPADFFLVHGDPLTDPSALWRVWRVSD
jgi:imidazolonepropionase-like amidohydrolase